MLKFSASVIWRLGTRATLRQYSSAGATVIKAEKLSTNRNIADKNGVGAETDGENKSGKNHT